MGIFRRSPGTPSSDPAIARFWEWWPEARERLNDGVPDDLAQQLATRIEAMHPDLEWEIGPGPSLTVSGGGVGELRGIAERWYQAAPDDGWEYRPARAADPAMLEGKLQLEEHEFDLSYVRLGLRADTRRARVDVTAYHPDFLFVPEETQLTLTYRVLDWALGEDDVARWIGNVVAVAEEPMDALPPSMLSAVVEQIAAPFREPAWLTGEGRTPLGHAARVAVRFPLHRQDHPLCDLYVSVALPYAHANPDRLPVEPSASALRDFEKAIEAMGRRVVLAAYESGDGRRVFHLYADPDSGAVAELDQLAAGWSEGRAKVSSQPDPAWQVLEPYQP
ncbi:DUF695 domain-containing protein [Actinoallomurus rhizosphaericola]|uniref:DUF695 domain-containing protein n=1 Tax=Actinoallomurus rhizosphaericola TaxID=2952536 RepID=UPI0020917932|nr:DUF695 domain-containing protein [Actinoallomurus rhizosphaericola]MCO5991966.1 DUF695 domain-containing protein [Actinoallomurus rhizosphaericola]